MDGFNPLDPASGWFGTSPADTSEAVRLDGQETAALEPVHDVNWDDEPAAAGPATVLEHALAMAARGFRILPLQRGDKIPTKGFRWKDEATTDTATIRTWFAAHPDANYAVAAGDGLLVVDLDPRSGAVSAISALPFALPAETLTVRTPGGGTHVYLVGPDVANSAGRLGPGIDIRSAGGYVVGPGSVFADPGGLKGYAGPYVIESDALLADAPEGLVLACGIPAARERDETPAAAQDQPEDIVRARVQLANAAPAIEGRGGDHRTYAVACELRDLGLTEGIALDLMTEDWNGRCLPPWSRDELAAKIANAFSYAQNRPATKSTAAVAEGFSDAVTIDSAALAAPPPVARADAPSPLIRRRIRAGEARSQVRWRVKDVLPATGVGMIFGPPSAGKSTLALDLAAHLSRGADWFGRRTRERAGTLILACEGAGSLGTRLDALGTEGGPMAIEAWDIGSLTTAGLASLRPELERLDASWRDQHGFGVGLVVLDTISASGMIDDENANAKVAAALKALADFAGSVGAFGLAVHHPRKDGETFRGAGAFEGNTDLIFEVRRGTSAGAGELSIYKARDAATGALGRFRLRQVTLGQDEDGEPITACVVEPKTAVFESEPVADPEVVLADLIRRGPDGDGPNTADTPGGCFRMDKGRSRDSIYRAIAEAFGIPFGTETGMLKLARSDRKAVADHLRRLNARLACTDDGRDRERRQVRVVQALHPRGATAADFGDAVAV
ncbi:MAG: hypothetical protein BVN31_07405 [Proteobacteria bacterium ST_bin15]|nr:MAG: hypothetical protein BVN31_07405 [Proteobacteria bacterium ST_bin15]